MLSGDGSAIQRARQLNFTKIQLVTKTGITFLHYFSTTIEKRSESVDRLLHPVAIALKLMAPNAIGDLGVLVVRSQQTGCDAAAHLYGTEAQVMARCGIRILPRPR